MPAPLPLNETNNSCSLAFTEIRESGGLSQSFVIMNVLATVIACYGLFADSPAVVIGAMLVAMMLGPLVALALGIVESDREALRRSIMTELLGVIIIYFTASCIGYFNADLQITHEILSRTSPSFMDLMIALAGGAAGAYAMLEPRVSAILVGAAVATALVPPLCSSAILLGRGEFGLAGNAALLAFVNMVAIEFAASITLFTFRCVKDPSGTGAWFKLLKRHAWSIIILLGLSVLLVGNLRDLVADQTFKTQTRAMIEQQISTLEHNFVKDVTFEKTHTSIIVRAEIEGPDKLTPNQVTDLADRLPKPPDNLILDLRMMFEQTTVITGDGLSLGGEQAPAP
jgi:uncharacterized hydrophobic protein (TIGR00271 family)